MGKLKIQGFTLVELVVLLLLIGIISATIIPRFLGPSAFDAMAARDSLITAARASQQLSLGRNYVTFNLAPSGDDWLVSANENGSIIYASSIKGGAISLSTKTTANAGLSCANTNNDLAIASLSVAFDGYGNAISYNNGGADISITNGLRMCIDNSLKDSICLSPSGYAYAGDCDD